MKSNLLKIANAQYGENGVNGRIAAELSLNNKQKCMGGEGAPDLNFDRVGFATVESFNFHIHSCPFEKQFYIPAGFIEQSDDKSRQIEVISKKNEELIGFWIAINDTAQWSGIRLLGLGPRKPNNLIGDDAFRLAGMTTVKLEVRFGSGDKPCVSLMDAPELGKVDVASVNQVEAACLEVKCAKPLDIIDFSICDIHQNRQGTAQIELGVNLDRSLASAEMSPRKQCQTQINRGRINGVNRGIHALDFAGTGSVQLACPCDEQQGKLFKYTAVAPCIGISQRAAYNRSMKPEMIELSAARPKTVFQIAQALPIREQIKNKCEQMVPRRQRSRLVVIVILGDNTAKFSLGKEINNLRKYKAPLMHGARYTQNRDKNAVD